MLGESRTPLEEKEKQMLEIAKLIQIANETTNTLFENSDQFKFKYSATADR